MNSIELFELNLNRAMDLLQVHRKAYPKGRPVSEGEAADLLRATVVFCVAALDGYIHRRVVEVVSKIISTGKRVPEKSIGTIVRQFKADDLPRQLFTIALHRRPPERIVELLRRALAVQTFQKPEQLDNAFEMMEIKEAWRKIDRLSRSKSNRRGRAPSSKAFLKQIVARRNDIVHEGDVYLGKRHHGQLKSIGRSQVTGWLYRLIRIVESIHKISETQA